MNTITVAQAIEKIEHAESCSQSELDRIVHKRLKSLVQYAKENSPFFAANYKDIEVDNFSLTEIPKLYKKEIQENYEDCLTDRSLTKAAIKTYLEEDGYKSGLLRGEYSVLTTSGSTGEPLLMIRDAYHNTIHSVLMQKRLLRGFDSKILSPQYSRIASVICTEGHVSSYLSFLKTKEAYPEYEHNMKAVSIFNSIDIIVKELNEFMPDVLTGYPSIIEQLAFAKKRGLLHINPKLIATSAEKLSNEVFLLLKELFNCPILNNYCSTEGGEIAMSCSEGHLHLNSDWLILEPVDENGDVVEDGIVSDKVLVTDLTNYILPIIRYEVDDRIIIYHKCACGSKLPYLEISGRVLDSLSLNGRDVPTPPIVAKVEALQGLVNWQLIQNNSKQLDCRCIFSDNVGKDSIKQEIKEILNECLTINNAIDVEICISEKPFIKNTKGGKVKRVLNLISNGV